MAKILSDYFNGLIKNLLSTLNTPDAYLNKIALTTITIVIGIFLHILFKNIIIRTSKDLKKRFRLNKIFKNAIFILTLLLVLFIWIQAINALILVALIFATFAVVMLRGLTHNIIGFFIIKYRKYFKVGQRIELNDIIGDVIDISPISFTLLEVRNWLSSDSNTGRVIKVPNSIIFEQSIEIVGLESIFIWHEIKYVLSFDSNWKQAEDIMVDAGEFYFKETLIPSMQENHNYLLETKKSLEPVFSLNTDDYGIIVVLRYMVDYRNGTSVRTSLQREILKKFEGNPEIRFAVSDIRILEK